MANRWHSSIILRQRSSTAQDHFRTCVVSDETLCQPVYAKKMVAAFGDKVSDIIEAFLEGQKRPPRAGTLGEGTDVGAFRAKRITDAWAEQKIIREIMVLLHSNGGGTARAGASTRPAARTPFTCLGPGGISFPAMGNRIVCSATRLLRNHWHCWANGALLGAPLAPVARWMNLPRRRVRRDGASVVAAMMLHQPEKVTWQRHQAVKLRCYLQNHPSTRLGSAVPHARPQK